MNLRERCLAALLENNPAIKCRLVADTFKCRDGFLKPSSAPFEIIEILDPGRPAKPELVAPTLVNKRGLSQQKERNYLMHALAHIEFNAINLALDAVYRFSNQPDEFYTDWLFVANDEARHFLLVCDYLKQNGVQYGDVPAHSGLWDMCIRTALDVTDRMALVPRVLEARGLDVSPKMIEKLTNVGDLDAAKVVNTIYHDEIEHVRIGSKWFKYQYQLNKIDAEQAFFAAIEKHKHGALRGPFNLEARDLAGFSASEMQIILNKYG